MTRAVSALRAIRGVRGSILALLLIIVTMPLISMWATFQIRELSDRITTVDNARLDVSRALRYALDEETGLRGYLATKDPALLEPYQTAHPKMEALLASLPQQFQRARLYGALPYITDFSNRHRAWHEQIAGPLFARPHRADAIRLEERGKRIFDAMRSDIAAIHAQSAAYTSAASRGMFDVMLMAGFLAVAWIGIVGAFTIHFERRAQRREMELVVSLIDEREAVERLSDWRSRLLAMLAHDFKSHLAVIIGAAHLLEDFPHRRGDPQLLASVRGAGYTLAEMADNAILLARAQEQRLVLQRTAFDVGEVVNTVVQRYGAQREFDVCAEAPAAMIEGDRSYVTRVLDNIIGNAVKYSEQPVRVRITEGEHAVHVTVEDRGVGISAADMPHIFEEFWRSENLQWSKKGSGVGLFIVKQIMEAHNGGIRVESKLGEGTTVTLSFPRALGGFTPLVSPPPERPARIAT